MPTLKIRPNNALIVVDMQNGVVGMPMTVTRSWRTSDALAEMGRREDVPVIWVQHSGTDLAKGSENWRIVPGLAPHDTESPVEKTYGDSFEDTDLEIVLSSLESGRLVVVGAQTDACILSTLHGAFVRGYDVTLIRDAHKIEDRAAWGASSPKQVIAHTNLYWSGQAAPGRKAATAHTEGLVFANDPASNDAATPQSG
jgi:nicotinamidase-related amidase